MLKVQGGRMNQRLLTAALALMVAGCSSAPPPLELQVFTSSENGYSVTSTLISGETDAILIDPQFLKSDALKVAEAIKATGKNLTAIYSTHAHPDHLFGVAVLKQEFPNARFVALPEVADRVVTGWPARRNFWYPTYGDELPGEEPVLPEKLTAPELTLEGQTFPITGEVIGDGPGNSFVHIPSLNAVVAGDIIFRNSHMGTPADPAPLYETFDKIMALSPQILVAGHQRAGSNNDPAEGIAFMKDYIASVNQMKMEAKTPEELKAKILEKYPGLALEVALDRYVAGAFPPPADAKGKAKGKG
jgi:glyoxylase-like metal-dependent hydrolase (beta-lactamase superfamily II)